VEVPALEFPRFNPLLRSFFEFRIYYFELPSPEARVAPAMRVRNSRAPLTQYAAEFDLALALLEHRRFHKSCALKSEQGGAALAQLSCTDRWRPPAIRRAPKNTTEMGSDVVTAKPNSFRDTQQLGRE